MNSVFRLRAPALTVAALAFSVTALSGAAAAEYTLGPLDKLKIKVYDWRPGANDTHEWSALTGEFVVGASGNLSLPIVGDLNVSHETTSQVAQKLAERVQSKLGLAQPPFASVAVQEYRPFYVIGFVDKPGEYAYRPGLTILQAVGISGGVRRLADVNLLSYERDALVNRGDLRTLGAERLQLLMRQARLKAEIDDNDTIALPPEIEAKKSDPAIARLIDEETQLFETYRKSLSSQLAILQQSKALLQQELKSLGAKEVAVAHQAELAKKELDTINALVNKGLAVTPRQVAVEQNLEQFESNRLDLQLAELRAQQDIARADRDGVELRNKRRSEALTEAADVRTRIASLDERIRTASALIYQSEVEAPEESERVADQEQVKPLYFIIRADADGVVRSHQAQEDSLVEPGDTVRVERARAPNHIANAKGE